jgi:signal transduction histidine kinase
MPKADAASGRATTTGSRLHRQLLLLGAGLVLLIVAADVHEAWQDYRSSLERSRQAVELLSHAFGDQTARMVEDLDFALADFADWARHTDITAGERDGITRELRAHVTRLPYVHSATVVDAMGRRIAATDDNAQDLGAGAPPSFAILQNDPSDTVRIGRPFTSRRDGYRTFALSRRLVSADGQFAGIVLARVSFDYLAHFYEAVNVSPGAEIRLSRSDGIVLALYPSGREDFPAAADANFVTAKAPVGGYPLEIEVAESHHDALVGWREQELYGAARTGTLTLLAGILLAAIMSALRRREQAEIARRESETQLQEARRAEALSLLAASVAHDFNNVLGAIVGYAELAREAGSDAAQLRSSLDRLLGAAERARQLVQRVLTLDPHRSVRDQTVLVAPIVREVVDQLQTHSARTLSFEVRVDDETLAVSGDSTEIYQVLLNLCTNAMQATPVNGKVAVNLHASVLKDAATLTVGSVTSGDYVSVTITDEGPGVSVEHARRIFDPLQTTKDPGQGTGIGLTVVRTIVERMRGAIEVSSAPSGGASFTIHWPRQAAAMAGVRAAPPAATVRPGMGQVVMIVDDEPQLASLLEDMAASLGYEPLGITDPTRALDVLRREPSRIDALVTDERMPGMRGTELARAVLELRPDLPILLVTGYRSADLDRDAGRAGVARILDKPVHRNELEHALGDLLH